MIIIINNYTVKCDALLNSADVSNSATSLYKRAGDIKASPLVSSPKYVANVVEAPPPASFSLLPTSAYATQVLRFSHVMA